ncbi:MAG TPA: hypothetical protein VFE31_09205, partial [Opitutaceae bacterium]|nr:hypothetical protein [Opitutaceae bacterium]
MKFELISLDSLVENRPPAPCGRLKSPPGSPSVVFAQRLERSGLVFIPSSGQAQDGMKEASR